METEQADSSGERPNLPGDSEGRKKRRAVRRRWLFGFVVLAAAFLVGRPYLTRHRNPAATQRMFAAMRAFDMEGVLKAVKEDADPDAEDDEMDVFIKKPPPGVLGWWRRFWPGGNTRTGKPTALMSMTYFAAYVNDDRPIRAMVEAGADLRIRDGSDRTARDYGELWGYGPGTAVYKLLTPKP